MSDLDPYEDISKEMIKEMIEEESDDINKDMIEDESDEEPIKHFFHPLNDEVPSEIEISVVNQEHKLSPKKGIKLNLNLLSSENKQVDIKFNSSDLGYMRDVPRRRDAPRENTPLSIIEDLIEDKMKEVRRLEKVRLALKDLLSE
jgi:hypothetical protein